MKRPVKNQAAKASIRYCTKGWSRYLTMCAKTIEDWRPSPDGVNEESGNAYAVQIRTLTKRVVEF
jgi:hypothetical protein